MPPTDLLLAVRRRPFEPFKLLISDGSTYEIRHPELLMVGLGSAIIGIPAAGEPPLYHHYETVDTRHIVKLIPLSASAAANGGQ